MYYNFVIVFLKMIIYFFLFFFESFVIVDDCEDLGRDFFGIEGGCEVLDMGWGSLVRRGCLGLY